MHMYMYKRGDRAIFTPTGKVVTITGGAHIATSQGVLERYNIEFETGDIAERILLSDLSPMSEVLYTNDC